MIADRCILPEIKIHFQVEVDADAVQQFSIHL